MFSKKQFIWFLGIYFAARLFSFWFGAQTPLQPQHPLNTVVSVAILLLAGFWIIKKDARGWIMVAGELLLGGGGNYLSVGGISLRTCLLLLSLGIFCVQKIANGEIQPLLKFYRHIICLFAAVYIVIIGAFAHGIFLGNDWHLAAADFIPYLFLLYYFPLLEIWSESSFKKSAYNLLYAAVAGNIIFVLFSLTGFSGGFFSLQGAYYHWYRDAALGKITDLGGNFFRLTLDEHLWLAPLLLLWIDKIIKKTAHRIDYLFAAGLLAVLSANFTRIYFVALCVGTIFLIRKANWRRWLLVAGATAACFLIIFTGLHLAVSGGKDTGLSLLGLRVGSIAAPQTEQSALSRMLLLRPIALQIYHHPLLGSGLGATVSAFSPVFGKIITTPHYDWGYLEIMAELGAIGVLVWFGLLFFAVKEIFRSKRAEWRGYFLAATVAWLIANITSPALFHVWGIVFLMLLFSPVGNIFNVSAGGVVKNRSGQIALVNNSGWTWSFPKGRVDKGENEITAARRETYEETGLTDLQYLDKLGEYERVTLFGKGDGELINKKIVMFLFTTAQTELHPVDPDNPEARWVDKNQAASLLTHPKDKEFFEKIKHRL